MRLATSRLATSRRATARAHFTYPTYLKRHLAWVMTAAFSLGALGEAALAQSSTNVASVAVDAFGEKVGSEQIGLYSEQQVRGFSLQESGNYRLDGSYFIRSANITDAALNGVTIRVGINALGVDFPAPSGIVEYRLPVAAPGHREQIEFALRDYGGYAVFARGSAATADARFGASYGLSFMNDTGSDGAIRRPRHLGFVPMWKPNERVMIKGMVSLDRFTRPGGDYTIAASETTLPPTQPHPGVYYADWAKTDQMQTAGGAVAQIAVSDLVSIQTSFVVTDMDRERGDFALLTLDRNGIGTINAVRSRPSHTRSMAGEFKTSWIAAQDHRLFGTLRWRRSESEVRPGVSHALGAVDQTLGVPVTAEPPAPTVLTPTFDDTRQIMAGLGYEANFTPALWVRGAVLRTRYQKQVTPPGAIARENVDSPWLYDMATAYDLTSEITLFATTVRGLEESGTAPNNAANRNEVLPAVMATQYEVGMRYRVSADITFIGSLFEVSKPTPGIDTQNIYNLIGHARHRGVELSLTGRPIPGVNIVGGLALLDAERSGALIDSGVLIGRAAGVPAVTGLINLTYQLPFFEGISLDSQLNYTSKRLLNPRTGVYTPAYATLDIGARYTFDIGGKDAVIRARIGNLFDEDAWMAQRSETLSRVQRRAFRLSLTTNFGN
jgi:iron complex outermembrane receptor protein